MNQTPEAMANCGQQMSRSLMKSRIIVNDVLEDLLEENHRLLKELVFANKYIKLFADFKTFIDSISAKIEQNLDSNDLKILERFERKMFEVTQQRQREPPMQLNHNLTDSWTREVVAKTVSTPEEKVDKQLMESEDSCGSFAMSGNISIDSEDDDIPRSPAALVSNKPNSYANRVSAEAIDSQSPAKKKSRLSDKSKPRDAIGGHTLACDWPDCVYTTTTQRALSYHKKLNHTDDGQHECSQCGKSFSSGIGLNQHVKLKHNSLLSEPIACDVEGCVRVFPTMMAFKLHKTNCHERDKVFNCSHTDCNFSSPNRKLLAKHRITEHPTDRPFHCTEEGCNVAFKTQQTLTDHLIRHNTERNFLCPHDGCGKRFKTQWEVNDHAEIHLEKTLVCDWPGCEYRASKPRYLKDHRVIHSGEMSHDCSWPQCGKSFRTKSNLRVHLRSHTGEKNHQCLWPGCQYRCTTSWNLRSHMKTHQKFT